MNRIQKLAFTGGRVYTPFGYKDTVLTEGDRIAFVGDGAGIGEGCERIELDGRTVVPGFCDSHMHFLAWASNAEKLDLKGSVSIGDIRKKVKDFVNNPNYTDDDIHDPWLLGRGWNQELFESDSQRMPTRHDIDDIVPNIPAVLSRVCGHVGVVNSAAMNKIGITRDTFVPGGIIDKGPDGEPNGIMREAAMELVWRSLPPLGDADARDLLNRRGRTAASYGLTTINSDDVLSLGGDYARTINLYTNAEAEGKLPFRMRQQFQLRTRERLLDFLARGWRTGMGGNRFKIGPLKIICDGSLGGRTAWMREDYADEPGARGIPMYGQEELDELVWIAHSSGLQAAIHAIGDATLDMCLNSLERAKSRRKSSLRHIIVHCQTADDEQLARVKRLGLGAAVQPGFAPSDRDMAARRLGSGKAAMCYRWRTMTEKGIVISAGSDAPVESPNPLAGIYAAVTRQDEDGRPYGGWLPGEKLSVAEAVNMYTWASAWHANEENLRGEIAVGKLADLAILEDDIFTIAPERIKDVNVSMTVCGGHITYNRGS